MEKRRMMSLVIGLFSLGIFLVGAEAVDRLDNALVYGWSNARSFNAPVTNSDPLAPRAFAKELFAQLGKDALTAASSPHWLSHINFTGSTESFAAALAASFQELSPSAAQMELFAYVGDCQVDAAAAKQLLSVSDVKAFLDSVGALGNGVLNVLLICSSSSSSEVSLNTAPKTGLTEAHMQVSELLESSRVEYVGVYVNEPWEVRAGTEALRRSVFVNPAQAALLAGATCGPSCLKRAFIFETLLVAITLLIALCCGFCCLSGIEGPSRFETAKDQ
eukprot:jgi/Mesen1/10928/ME000095S10272